MIYPLRWRTIDCCRVAALAFGLAGCSIHPLPENVSPAATFDIVHRIRCEAWEGMSEFLPPNDAVRRIIEGTTIGYDFVFDMTESNSSGGGKLEFKRPSFKDPDNGFFLELTASDTRTRQNTRAFRILEQLTELKDAGCSQVTTRPNPVYPITGATGMAEVVRTYIRLELLTNLERAGTGANQDVVFSDELHFTTKLSAGVMPTLELVSVAGSFRLTDATFMGSISRNDIHSVTVALNRDPAHADVSPKVARANEAIRMLADNEGALEARPLRNLVRNEFAGARNRVLLELQRRNNKMRDAITVSKVLGIPVP